MYVVAERSYTASYPTGEAFQKPRFAATNALPWDIRLSQNQLLNRLFIESIGSFPWNIGLARNKYERLEQVISIANYLLAGIALPLGLEWAFKNKYTKHLRKRFNLSHNANPLALPFELLERNGYEALKRSPEAAQKLKAYGLESAKQLTPELLKRVKLAKAQIILVDSVYARGRSSGSARIF